MIQNKKHIPFTKNKELLIKKFNFDKELIIAYDNYFQYGIESNYHIPSKSLLILSIFFSFGILFQKFFIYFFELVKGINKKEHIEFNFFTTYHTIIRSLQLNIITNKKFRIIYLPSFNFKEILRHFRAHLNNKTSNLVFSAFSIKTIGFIWIFYLRFKILQKTFNTDGMNRQESNYFIKLLFQYKIYKHHFQKIKDLYGDTKNWIFDYDKSIFMPIIHCCKNNNITTTHLQHGIFIKPNQFYIPLLCENVLCCSQREKEYYLSNKIDNNNVFVLGAPLQSIRNINCKPLNISSKRYDILILLTNTNDSFYYESQKKLIIYLEENYKHLNLLFRFRPASRITDYPRLIRYIKSFDISTNASIDSDILISKKIISYSIDSIFVAKIFKTPFIILHNPDDIDLKTKNHIIPTNLENINNHIEKLISIDADDLYLDHIFDNIFGITDVSKIQENFIAFLDYLKKKSL